MHSLKSTSPSPENRLPRVRAVHGIVLVTAAVAALAPTGVLAAETRSWEASIQTFVGNDSNAPIAAQDTTYSGQRSSSFMGIGASGQWHFPAAGEWRPSIAGHLTMLTYANSEANQFRYASGGGTFALARDVPSLNGALQLTVGLQRDRLGGRVYASSYSLGAALPVQVGAWLLTPGLGLTSIDFADDGTVSSITSRDAKIERLGISASRELARNHWLSLGYSYVVNRADGSNFDYHGNAFDVQYRAMIFPVILTIAASRNSERYPDYTPEPRRSQDNRMYRLGLTVPLSGRVSLEGTYSITEYRGKSALFDANRNQATLGIAYRF